MSYKPFFPDDDNTISNIKKSMDDNFNKINNDQKQSNEVLKGYLDKIMEKFINIPDEIAKIKEDIEVIKNTSNPGLRKQPQSQELESNSINPSTQGNSFNISEYSDDMDEDEANDLVDRIKGIFEKAGFKIMNKVEDVFSDPRRFIAATYYNIGKFLAHMYTGKEVFRVAASGLPNPFRSILYKTYNTSVSVISALSNLVLKPLLGVTGIITGIPPTAHESSGNTIDALIESLKINDDSKDNKDSNDNKDSKEQQNMFSSMAKSIVDGISKMIFGEDDGKKDFKSKLANFISESITSVFTKTKDVGKKVGEFFNQLFSDAFGKDGFMTNFIAKFVNESNEFISTIMNNKDFDEKIVQPIKNIWSNIKHQLFDEDSELRSLISDLWSMIKSEVSSHISDLVYDVIKDAISKITNPVKDTVRNIGSLLTNGLIDDAETKREKEAKIKEEERKQKFNNLLKVTKLDNIVDKVTEAKDNIKNKMEELNIQKTEKLVDRVLTEDQIKRQKEISDGLSQLSESDKNDENPLTELANSTKNALSLLTTDNGDNKLDMLSNKIDNLITAFSGGIDALSKQSELNSATIIAANRSESLEKATNIDTKEGE